MPVAHTIWTGLAITMAVGPSSAMTLSSPDIAPESAIAAAHIYPRCGGANISPALVWSGVPTGARSLVLTMIDQSVEPALWSHWIVVDLPPTASGLARGVSTLPAKAHAVAGNFGDAAYDGPCPPKGSGTHRYAFTLWAMPTPTTAIAPNADAREVQAGLARQAVARASFTGLARR